MVSCKLVAKLMARGKKMSGILFGRYLLATNLGISVSLSVTGDVLQQYYSIVRHDRYATWNVGRTRNMAAAGLTTGLLCHYWYLWLDVWLPGKTMRIILKKLVVDQFILSPVLITVFFLTLGALEGCSVDELKKDVVEKGFKLYMAEWFVWPPAQVINFAFLPTKYRVMYDTSISLGFDIYGSYLKHEDNKYSKDSIENSKQRTETNSSGISNGKLPQRQLAI